VRTPEQILRDSATIAVVGASRHEDKTAYAVPLQMKLKGWKIIPVNPHSETIFGEVCYPSLEAIPFPVDLVNVFRPSADTPPIARSAVAIGAKALWLQQGIVSAEARRIAEEGGLEYVENRCTAVVRATAAISKN